MYFIQDATRCTWPYHLSCHQRRAGVISSMPNFCNSETVFRRCLWCHRSSGSWYGHWDGAPLNYSVNNIDFGNSIFTNLDPCYLVAHRSISYTHYNDVIMTTMASQFTNLTVVYSTVYSDADQRKHQSSASLAFVWGNSPGPVNSPHKGPVTRKMLPFDDVIMRRIVIP